LRETLTGTRDFNWRLPSDKLWISNPKVNEANAAEQAI
jgi:hypothetical protein